MSKTIIAALPASLAANPRLDQWVRFVSQSRVEIASGKVELGQGVSSALMQVAAEELGLPAGQIRLISGDTSLCPNEGVTAGSLSVETGVTAMRAACAEARTRLVRKAAALLATSPENIAIRDGYMRSMNAETGTAFTYWQLAGQIDWTQPATGSVLPICPAMPRAAMLPRPDLPEKLLSGGFIHDLTLEGMLHARVVRCAHPRARLASFENRMRTDLAERVQLVRNGSFLAVLAVSEIDAVRAHESLAQTIRWEFDPLPEYPAAGEMFRDADSQMRQVHLHGDEPASNPTESASTIQLQRRFSRPFLAHASIGPSCALARHDDTGLTVWSHTQAPFLLARQLSQVTRIPSDRIRVIHASGAGCYGHNGADDVALDAALLAVQTGLPVRVLWTRRDELACAPFGSAMQVEIAAQADSNGRLRHWRQTVTSHSHVARPGLGDGIDLRAAWDIDPPMPASTPKDFPPPAGGGDRNAIPIYTMPHQDIRYAFVADAPLRVSAIRSLGAFANIFAIESMMDEVAAAVGQDPIALRLMHLEDPRGRAVIESAAETFGWAQWRDPGDGSRGRGIGFGRYKNTAAWCAVIVDLDIGATLRVRRAVAAVDAGCVVHHDGLVQQIEGGILQAISWTLKESVRWNPEGVAMTDWEDYPILGFDECPELSVVVIDHPEAPSLGTGECAAGPTAAAIGNALAQGLGIRATDLPLTPENITRHMEST
jgi:nicotinate dehydrogenase subunit B